MRNDWWQDWRLWAVVVVCASVVVVVAVVVVVVAAPDAAWCGDCGK